MRNDIHLRAANVDSEIETNVDDQIYSGTAVSPRLLVKLKDYEQFATTLQARFQYIEGGLRLPQVVIRGDVANDRESHPRSRRRNGGRRGGQFQLPYSRVAATG
jgi:hypothetical protein